MGWSLFIGEGQREQVVVREKQLGRRSGGVGTAAGRLQKGALRVSRSIRALSGLQQIRVWRKYGLAAKSHKDTSCHFLPSLAAGRPSAPRYTGPYDPSAFAFRSLSTAPPCSPLMPSEEPLSAP
ncbi:unnamed protein product [Boreogadus saida]